MTDREIIQHIDEGADYYVSLFGEAEYMEKMDRSEEHTSELQSQS